MLGKAIVLLLVTQNLLASLATSQTIDVRLAYGRSPNEGTIEVKQDNGAWRTYYGIYLTDREVIVICRQLGYPGINSFFHLTPFNFSSIFTDSFYSCDTGDELHLLDCLSLSIPSNTARNPGSAICYNEGYLGCFRDDSLTDLLRGDNVSIHEIIPDGTSVSVSPSNFINFCINYCRNSSLGNFTHAGVRSGIECFCTEVGGNFSLQGMVDDQSCRLPCPSESDTSCNNTGLTNVFDLSKVSAFDLGPVAKYRVMDPTGTETEAPVILTKPPTNQPVTETEVSEAPVISTKPTTNQPVTETEVPKSTSQIYQSTQSLSSKLLKTVPPKLENDNIVLYIGAGAGGGGALVLLIVFVAICLFIRNRTSSKEIPKESLEPREEMVEPIPLNVIDNTYESVYLDQSDEASTDIELKPRLPAPRGSGKDKNSASIRTHDKEMNQQPEDKNRIADTGDNQMNATEDLSALYTKPHKKGSNIEDEDTCDLNAKPDQDEINHKPHHMNKIADTEDDQMNATEDISALYSKPHKNGSNTEDDDVSALYTKPDKKGKASGRSSVKPEHIGENDNDGTFPLYALPDKKGSGRSGQDGVAYSKPQKEKRSDQYATPEESSFNHSETMAEQSIEDEGLYSEVKDNLDSSATEASAELIVDLPEEGQGGMVDNEPYTMDNLRQIL